MYYRNKEERDAAIRRHIEDRKQAAGLFSEIRPIIESFNGKCFNCRFQKALQEKTGRRIYAKLEYNHLNIYIYASNSNNVMTLASVHKDDMPDGKRIPAELLIDDARRRRAGHLKEAASMEAAIDSAEAIKGQMKALEAKMKALQDQISSYTAREIYGLNFRITYS